MDRKRLHFLISHTPTTLNFIQEQFNIQVIWKTASASLSLKTKHPSMVIPSIFHIKALLHVSGRGTLSSPVQEEKKIMQNKERNFSPSVFLRELSHACRKLQCLHYGINSEGLKSPTVRDALLPDPKKQDCQSGWRGQQEGALSTADQAAPCCLKGNSIKIYFLTYLHGRRQRRTHAKCRQRDVEPVMVSDLTARDP